jgi:hypothetical protein
MLSAVLRSDRAVQMSIAIVRTFVRMRELMTANKEIAARVEKLERGPRSHRLGHRGAGGGHRSSGARGQRHEGANAGDEAAHRIHPRRRVRLGPNWISQTVISNSSPKRPSEKPGRRHSSSPQTSGALRVTRFPVADGDANTESSVCQDRFGPGVPRSWLLCHLRGPAFRRHISKADFSPLTSQSSTVVALPARDSWMARRNWRWIDMRKSSAA